MAARPRAPDTLPRRIAGWCTEGASESARLRVSAAASAAVPRHASAGGSRLRRVLSRRAARIAKGTLGVLVLLAAWQVSVPMVGLGAYFYPAPVDVWNAFVDLLRKGILPVYFADSMARYGAGLAIGALLGVSAGVAIGLHRTIAVTLSPLLEFLFAIVEVA